VTEPADNDRGATGARPRGPANRSLAELERVWVTTRWHLDAAMEEGRLPIDRWVAAKLNATHGNFNIGDPNDPQSGPLQAVKNGVRQPPLR
jgi:hypothetical protein